MLEVREDLVRPPNLSPPKRESQEHQLVGLYHSTLLLIALQLQLSPQVSADTPHHTLPCSAAANQDREVIGISGKTQPTTLQLFVQIIQKDVGQ